MNCAIVSRAISFPIAFFFSGPKQHRSCLSGFAPLKKLSEWSASCRGTPDISEGDHAKIFRLSQRNLMSSPSYALLRSVPMLVVLLVYLSSRAIFLELFLALKVT